MNRFTNQFLFAGMILSITFLSCTKNDTTVVQAPAGDAKWHEVGTSGEPQFLSGWGNYSTAFSSCAFRKDGEGTVRLKGTVSGGASGNTTTIFNLPAGYGTAQGLRFVVQSNNSSQTSTVDIYPINDTICYVRNLTIYSSYISLDGISFVADR